MFNLEVYEFPPLEARRGREFKIGLERTDEEVAYKRNSPFT